MKGRREGEFASSVIKKEREKDKKVEARGNKANERERKRIIRKNKKIRGRDNLFFLTSIIIFFLSIT